MESELATLYFSSVYASLTQAFERMWISRTVRAGVTLGFEFESNQTRANSSDASYACACAQPARHRRAFPFTPHPPSHSLPQLLKADKNDGGRSFNIFRCHGAEEDRGSEGLPECASSYSGDRIGQPMLISLTENTRPRDHHGESEEL